MKNEILRTIIAYPEATIQDVHLSVQNTFPFCSISEVKRIMADEGITRPRNGAGYRFDIPARVIRAVEALNQPTVQKRQVHRKWPPDEMKECALSKVMEREKHRWRVGRQD